MAPVTNGWGTHRGPERFSAGSTCRRSIRLAISPRSSTFSDAFKTLAPATSSSPSGRASR